jgi:phosphoribosylformylglycinamidine synthase subunit PurSL
VSGSTTTPSSTPAGLLWRITVWPRRPELDSHGAAVLHDIRELGLPHAERVSSGRIFFMEGELDEPAVKRIAAELLADPITETFTLEGNASSSPAGAAPVSGERPGEAVIEVHLKGGVMDPVASSTVSAIADMDVTSGPIEVATARIYRVSGLRSIDDAAFIARRLLSNDCIEDVYLSGFGRHDPRPSKLPHAPTRPFQLRHVALRELDDAGLAKLSREGHLFCSLDEMHTIQAHFRDLGRDPTDLELETLAQTWSEHCVHKTFRSNVHYVGTPFPNSTRSAEQSASSEGQVEVRYENLLKDTIARATHELMGSGRVNWCLSVFEDNAGVIVLDDDYGIAFKVETHNHPSAIEPYGGSATGSGGVIRDVMGCGLGAKPIANTDVFCVGRPEFPMDLLPKGVLHPRRVLKGIVRGVRDYGNRMGIPTLNGAILFDDRYLGNPLVFCGCVGLIPRNRIQKEPKAGDLVVVLGGRTGRDGIHGATFSSAELTDTHADEFSHAVQIGNAITEKQVLDAMLQARDYPGGCLYTATTDCGAGGLSSAVGEMGRTLGATVELDKVTLKYAGLRYDEIWISEAQERMVLSVPPANWDKIKRICDAEGVEATVIGTFRNDGRLVIRYNGQTVGDMNTDFLHDGIPRMHKEAVWSPPSEPKAQASLPEPRAQVSGSAPTSGRAGERESGRTTAANPPSLKTRLLAQLSDLDAASKEWVIRQYDHEVQGRSVVKPLVGPGQGPSDAAVIRPRLDAPSLKSQISDLQSRGLAIANGICPELADVDPYWMAVAGIDECIRNLVCVGGDPARTAILDNFCWGNCEDPQTMGALVRACQACYDAAMAYGTPFISGKDSLNNEFALDPADAERLANRIPLHNNRIRIPSTLLISGISIIEDVAKCVTMDAKPADEPSEFYFVGLRARQWQDVNIADAAALHKAVAGLIHSGAVLAAHDCGSSGVLPALAEMAFAGQCGMDVSFADDLSPFDPIPSGYVLQIFKANTAKLQALAGAAVQVTRLGTPRGDTQLRVGSDCEINLADLSAAWRSSLNW